MRASSSNQNGFTVVEVIVVVTVLSLLTGIVLQTLGGFFNDNISSLGKAAQDTQTRGVLRQIVRELSNTNGFMTDITSLSQPLGRNDQTTWSYLGNISSQPFYDSAQKTNRVLIATSTATDKANSDPTRLPIFINAGLGCDPSLSPIALNALVFFVAKNPTTGKYDLYRRTITNVTGGTLCSNISQQQTCSPAAVSSYATICKGVDANLLRNIDSFTVDYFTSPNDALPISNQYGGTPAVKSNIQAAKAIKITVTTNDFIDGKYVQNSASIRASLNY